MKVTRLPVDCGTTGWNAILPPAAAFPQVEGAVTCDWLIIGAGFAGLAAARRLSQICPGDKVVLVEAKRLAEGPAGRNSGFMIDLPHHLDSGSYVGDGSKDADQTALNRTAIAFVREAAEEFRLSGEVVDPCGKVNAAASPNGDKHNREYAEQLEAIAEPHSLLDAEAMKDLTGSSYYSSGLYTPGTVMLQPAAYVRGMAKGLENTVSIYENSPVTSLDRDGNGWRAMTPDGSVTAGKVILATNGHVESFGYFKRQLVHIHLFASMTRALSEAEIAELGGESRWGLTPSDPAGTTVRRISGTGGSRIIVRNRVEYTPSLETSERRIAEFGRTQDKSFRARFPNLSAVEMEYRWGGRLCMSLNEAPAFGELEGGIYSACCQNGLGAARGTLMGMYAADLAAGRLSAELDLLLAEGSPKKLPPAPIDWLGANASIRWKELRAGREL